MANIVIKVGGNELDYPAVVQRLVEVLVSMREPRPVLVHGGGKEIAALQGRLGLVPQFIEGLRVTDADSLRVAEMVLSGSVNKRLVACLVMAGAEAIGLSGVDLGLVRVDKMVSPKGDLGLVGAVKGVNARAMQALLDAGMLPVVSPISLGYDGQTYNVNADHVALGLTLGLGAGSLLMVTNVPGVLVGGEPQLELRADRAVALIEDGTISGGMVPKVRSALEAVAAGVPRAVITDVAGLEAIATGREAGTIVRS